MKIAHIADVHIRLYKRHDEYREVFDRLYRSLREHKVDRIALLGDIFHSKSILSPEAVDLASEFFRELAKIAPLDIIVGNHDVNVKNDTRMDAISPIVDILNEGGDPTRITVYKESGEYMGIGTSARDERTVIYGVFSLLDEKNFPIHNTVPKPQNVIDDYCEIALFHGNLSGSFSENMFKFENTGYDPDVMFKQYSMAMLGDIHRRQEIRPKMWYAGSLIQQDYGESLEKGYLIWDTGKKKEPIPDPVFVPIKNDYAFYNLRAAYKVDKNNLPSVSCSAKPRIRLTLSNFDYSIAELKEIEIALTLKYNPITLEVKKEVVPQVKKDQKIEKIKSTSDISVQNDLIRKFLGTEATEEELARLFEINKEIRLQVNEEDILSPVVWKIKEMEWSNTFSYGPDNYLNFEKFKGLVGIFAPNRSGKSNFIDTILYTLFNKSARVPRITKMINNQMDECKSTITLEVEGELWRVIRKSVRGMSGGTSTKVILEKRIDSSWQSETGESRTDTDKILRRLIGNFDDLIISSISPQGKISYFLDSGLEDTFRLELLSRFLGLNIFKFQYEIANRKLNEFEVILKQSRQIDYSSLVKAYHDEAEKITESLTDFEEDKVYVQGQLEQLSVQIATLKAMIQEVVDDSKVTEYEPEKLETLAIQIRAQKNAENNLLNDEIQRLEKLRESNLDDLLKIAQEKVEKLIELQKEIQKIDADIRVAKVSLNKDRSRVEILNSQPWTESNELCNECSFWKDADKLRKELSEIEQSVLRLQKNRSELEEKAAKLSSSELEAKRLRELIDETKKLDSSIRLRKTTIEKQELQVEKVQGIIQEQNREAQKIAAIKQIKESNAQVNTLLSEKEKEKTEIQKQFNLIEYNITSHLRRVSELDSKMLQAELSISKLASLEKESSDYKTYVRCMHREGIPYSVMSNYIDIINTEIARIVGDYIPFGINFSLDAEKRTVSINLVYENGTVNPIELGSGMEKMISAIAIRATLVSISNIPHCNLFVIDESFGQLDPDNLATIDKFLDHLKTMFETVLLISHVPGIQDFVDQTITIDTSTGFSKINFG